MTQTGMSSHVLDRLVGIIAARKGTEPDASYTAELLAGGPEKAARKLGEEAVEAVIEAMRGDRAALAAESADLLYHLLVLWAAVGVEARTVWAALEAREGMSGHAEKAARKPHPDPRGDPQ